MSLNQLILSGIILIQALYGVLCDVKCDLPSKTITVSYHKDKNNPAEIKKAIEKPGYTAKQVTEEKSEKK